MSDDLTPATWRKSTRSQGATNCVEVADLPNGARAVRHTKNRDGAVLTFTEAEWRAFILGAVAGEFGKFD